MKMSEETNDRLIELTDGETGEKIVFEHLDTVVYGDKEYFVLTEFFEEEPEESDVFVMSLVTDDDGEETLELAEDDEVIDYVFDEFKKRSGDAFDFLD
jgi:hypothetical protein